jgi:NAD(P)-dependent dehydrogenase (short-subunit alcohol dehydrogenase family)
MSALSKKVVIVTGGSSGIGRAAALEAVAAGHSDIVAAVADAASPEDAGRVVGEAVVRWGRLDVLVNNAGAGAILPLAEATAEKVRRILAVNVLGPSLLAAAALPHLAATTGSIVNISSTFGHRPAAGLAHYAASKAALEHLTRCWALELAPQASASTRWHRARPNRGRGPG